MGTVKVLALALALWLGSLGSGCDRRAGAIRESLPERDQTQFDLGRRAASGCWVCHDFYERNNKIGPTLSGLFGRTAGSVPEFGYSEAMRGSGVVWTEDNLRRFLSAPQVVVPGNSMAAPPVPAGEELDALIFYMKQVAAPGP